MTTGHEDYLGDLWDLLPTDPTDFLEDTPTEDESEKAPSSEWAFDHKADTDAHHTKFTIAEHDLAARHSLAVLDSLVCSEAEAAGLISDHKDLVSAHHTKFTAANARSAINDIFGADGKADSNIDLDSNSLLNADNISTKTSAGISKTIGATGDYATFAAAIAALPDLMSHDIDLTLQIGTTLTEICLIQNRHGLASGLIFTVKAARYYPTSGAIPTADGAGVAYLEDVSVFTVDDYYNDCWILVVDGTGTDNGYVKITDTDQATGRASVVAWPGTQPDNTSRYIIVGALVDCEAARSYAFDLENNTVQVDLKGIGILDATSRGIIIETCFKTYMYYCGVFDCAATGIELLYCYMTLIRYCGIVKNNTVNNALHGGVRVTSCNRTYVHANGISDNSRRGVYVRQGSFGDVNANFGDLNGTYGTYAEYSGQAYCHGSECSGTTDFHGNGVGDGSLAY